jgi:hypothetical protein
MRWRIGRWIVDGAFVDVEVSKGWLGANKNAEVSGNKLIKKSKNLAMIV